MTARFTSVSDHGLLVTFADTVSEESHQQVLALDAALTAQTPDGVTETVPALVNLMLLFDPLVTDHEALKTSLTGILHDLRPRALKGELRHIDVCYEPPFSPDLAAVASAKGLSTEAVINAHLSGDYHVLMYGFSPGYAYIAGIPDDIQVPRKPSPVRDVPAGSVIIAGAQCLVSTLKMPTGWSIIGRSPTPVLTGNADKPFLFDVGDRVQFHRIDQATYDAAMQGRADA